VTATSRPCCATSPLAHAHRGVALEATGEFHIRATGCGPGRHGHLRRRRVHAGRAHLRCAGRGSDGQCPAESPPADGKAVNTPRGLVVSFCRPYRTSRRVSDGSVGLKCVFPGYERKSSLDVTLSHCRGYLPCYLRGAPFPRRFAMRLNHSEDQVRSFSVPEFLVEPGPTRWVASRKAAVVLAIRSGLISTSDACQKYLLSADELARWHASFDGNGPAGLLLKCYSKRLAQVPSQSDHCASHNKAPREYNSIDSIRLTRTESVLFKILAQHTETVISKDTLFHLLYCGSKIPDIKIIDVIICNIRRKIRKIPNITLDIRTVWGRGYILCALPSQNVGPHKTNRTACGPELSYNAASQWG
jgi:DNA-binding winged helix-turn-helix (wHTH) protein